jgi:hypothetical protein
MAEVRRIQRIWGYIEIHYNESNEFINILANGERIDLEIDRVRNNVISVGHVGDYLIIAESDSFLNVWKRGDVEPKLINHGYDLVFLNSDICYFSFEEHDEYLLRVIPTKSLLEWISDHNFRDKDLVDVWSLRSQILDKINTDGQIVGIDNVGHILVKDGENYKLLDYSQRPRCEIDLDLDGRSTPILNTHGNYIGSIQDNRHSQYMRDENLAILCVERYYLHKYEHNKFINVSINQSHVGLVKGTRLEVEDNVVLVWLDSETLLLYNTKAILLNVSNGKSVDITDQAIHFTGVGVDQVIHPNTDDEIFILADGGTLSIERVKEFSRWLKYKDVGIHAHIPETVIDHVYKYIK